MKTSLIALTLLIAHSQAVLANDIRGPKCGLPESTEVDTWVEKKSKALHTLNKKQVSELPLVEALQILYAARNYDDTATNFLGKVEQAIDYLKDHSSGGEVYLQTKEYSGKTYAQVSFYPGGNEVGSIFENEATEVLATIGDGSIFCEYTFQSFDIKCSVSTHEKTGTLTINNMMGNWKTMGYDSDVVSDASITDIFSEGDEFSISISNECDNRFGLSMKKGDYDGMVAGTKKEVDATFYYSWMGGADGSSPATCQVIEASAKR